jgi:hypothetical protein
MVGVFDNDHDFAKAVRTKLNVESNDAAMEAIGELQEVYIGSQERELRESAPAVDDVPNPLDPQGPLTAPSDISDPNDAAPNPPEALGGEPHGRKVDPSKFAD